MRWIASWTAAPMNVWGPDAPLSGFYGQTIREIMRVSIGGQGLILRLTNEFGPTPLFVEKVEIGMAGDGGRLEPLTTRQVTFGGCRSATIPAGCPLLSDPIDLDVGPLSRLAVSYYSSGFIPLHTRNPCLELRNDHGFPAFLRISIVRGREQLSIKIEAGQRPNQHRGIGFVLPDIPERIESLIRRIISRNTRAEIGVVRGNAMGCEIAARLIVGKEGWFIQEK